MKFEVKFGNLEIEAKDRHKALEKLGAIMSDGRIFHDPYDPSIDLLEAKTGLSKLYALLSEAEPNPKAKEEKETRLGEWADKVTDALCGDAPLAHEDRMRFLIEWENLEDE